MGLELRRDKKHNLRSKWWYARYTVNGKRRFVNLGVEVKGTAPKTLRKQGNMAFECSRTLAAAKLQELLNEANSHKAAEKHLQELYEIKSGESVEKVPVSEITARWVALPTRKKRTEKWEKEQCGRLTRFSEYIQKNYPTVEYISQITPKIAKEWLEGIADQFAPATYNDYRNLLKGFFERAGHEAGVIQNPFAGCDTKVKKTIHRQPFTQDELTAILEHCDAISRPVTLTAMCTAMRRGDCCRLKWESVDLDGGFVTVQTSKTGEVAEIPLFPVLRAELEKLPRVSEYVFPEAEEMYRTNIHGLSWRFKQALKNAGIETTQIKREDSGRQASVKDFHSLRTTWITMALSAGVPMELVRRVTGHSTVDVVLKHYFRPGKEAFKTALETAMPKMLTGSGNRDQESEIGDQTPSNAQGEQSALKEVRWLLKYGEDLEKDAILRRLVEVEEHLAA